MTKSETTITHEQADSILCETEWEMPASTFEVLLTYVNQQQAREKADLALMQELNDADRAWQGTHGIDQQEALLERYVAAWKAIQTRLGKENSND